MRNAVPTKVSNLQELHTGECTQQASARNSRIEIDKLSIFLKSGSKIDRLFAESFSVQKMLRNEGSVCNFSVYNTRTENP